MFARLWYTEEWQCAVHMQVYKLRDWLSMKLWQTTV